MKDPIVTVYTKAACHKCDATKKWLDKHNVEYTTRRIDLDDEARDIAISLGHKEAPVVTVDYQEPGEMTDWSGFRPSMLEQLVAN